MSPKVALITGAARRVGAEIARYLHQEGMNIVLHCRNALAEAEQLSAKLNAQRANSAIILQADLHQTEKLQNLIAQAHQHFGRLDALVNNASSFYPTPLGNVPESSWDELIGSNLKSPFFLAEAAAPLLAEHHGCIVNITDVNVYHPLKTYSVYCIAKAGLETLTRAFALELAPKIRVNAVAPGSVLWPEASPSAPDEFIKKIPLRRMGSPYDIAQAVHYLLNAPYVTGQVISVDGGASL